MTKWTRELFEKHFKDVNASWDFEDAALNEAEKELLFKRLTGEISDQEYMEAILGGRSNGQK